MEGTNGRGIDARAWYRLAVRPVITVI